MTHPAPHVLGRDRQRCAASMLRAVMEEESLHLCRRRPMVAGFARALAEPPGNPWPMPFLRSFAGSVDWDPDVIRDVMNRSWTGRKFPDEIAALHQLEPWPLGAVAFRDVFMGHSRQKALAWCLGGAVACAWPSGAPDGIGDLLAVRFGRHLDRVNGPRHPALVFRSAWTSRDPR